MIEEGEKRANEADTLKQELLRARLSEKEAKEKLIHLVTSMNNRSSFNHSSVNASILNGSMLNSSIINLPPPTYSHGR